MKSLYAKEINQYRRIDEEVYNFYGHFGDANGGVFMVPIRTHPIGSLKVIASSEGGWDHISASLPDRCPTWDEMCLLKDLFFSSYELVLQFHPPKSEYVNHHPYTLHLWRPQKADIPLPPSWMVGPKK